MKDEIFLVPDTEYRKDDLKFLNLLEDNVSFWELIRKWRAFLEIPLDGEDLNENTLPKLIVFRQANLPSLNTAVAMISVAFKLTPRWSFTLEAIIYCNLALAPESPVSLSLKKFKLPNLLGGEEFRNYTSLLIRVEEKISVEQIISELRALESDEKKVSQLLNELQAFPEEFDIKKFQNSDEMHDIFRLRELGKSHGEIAKIIQKKYGNKLGFTPTNKSVQQYFSRYKQKLDSMTNKKIVRLHSKLFPTHSTNKSK